jgi:hypothetical protein
MSVLEYARPGGVGTEFALNAPSSIQGRKDSHESYQYAYGIYQTVS